jgi:hypothetical protein
LLAAWWAIKPSWKRIKEFLKNEELPFFYIQSKQDKMMHFSFFNKILQLDKYHKCHVINGGYHVLSAEEKWGEKLFELIDRLFILS